MSITITTPPEKLVASKNDNWVEVSTTDTNVVMRLEALSMPGGQIIATVYAPVDSTGAALFNLKRILQSMGVAPDVLGHALPEFNQVVVTVATANVKDYALNFASLDRTTNAVVSSATHDTGLQVLLAGKSFVNGHKNLLLDIIGDGAAPRKFLTCGPQLVKTQLETQRYLYYYHNPNGLAPGDLKLSLNGYLSGGATFSKDYFDPLGAAPGQILVVPVGFDQLNLAADIPPGEYLIKYEVFLSGAGAGGAPVTATHAFEMDYRCLRRKKEFIFLNSLGGIDTVYSVDTEETNTALQAETAERFLQPAYNPRDGQYFNFYKQRVDGAKCTTDLLTFAERMYLREFFGSASVWEISETGFLPVILTDNNFTVSKGRGEVQNIQFSYRYAFDEIAYNNF